MWLTGFDAPSLHTMYVDKPMRGHGLMQAIARVNRVFGDKPGGLIVDYIGLAYHLKQALANYTESGGKGSTAINKAEAVAVMQEKHEICCGLFYSFDWSAWITGTPTDRLKLLPSAQEHILKQTRWQNPLTGNGYRTLQSVCTGSPARKNDRDSRRCRLFSGGEEVFWQNRPLRKKPSLKRPIRR